eukprot:14168-Amphidinium_carterae.3
MVTPSSPPSTVATLPSKSSPTELVLVDMDMMYLPTAFPDTANSTLTSLVLLSLCPDVFR